MMAGNPNWWSMITGMHPHESHHHHHHHQQQQQQQLSNSHQFAYGAASNSSNSGTTTADDDHHHPAQDHFPPVRSWSQLLLGGLGGGEDQDKFGGCLFPQQKKLQLQEENNWDDQNQLLLNLNPRAPPHVSVDHVKQENINNTSQSSCTSHLYDDNRNHHQFQLNNRPNSSSTDWLLQHQGMPVSSPTSCITTLSNNILNFSGGKPLSGPVAAHEGKSHNQHNQDHSAECNSTSTGAVAKKARVQQSSAQSALKVRKEKLGDRITALHQLVSPFGKTDTASVLSEAIGYIRFLQGQIEALSSPYMRNGSASTTGHHQHYVQERNCLFPQEPTQFLNDHIGMEARGASKLQDSTQSRGGVKDLRSRGLCLVPISCTQNVANDSGGGPDYWAPSAALGGGGF